MTAAVGTKRWTGPDGLLNTRYHKAALTIFMVVVAAHWAERTARASQIYVPTSIARLVFPRVELHLFYNVIVFVPMVVAMVHHRRARQEEIELMRCLCARLPAPASA